MFVQADEHLLGALQQGSLDLLGASATLVLDSNRAPVQAIIK